MEQSTQEKYVEIPGFSKYEFSNKGNLRNKKTGKVLNCVSGYGYELSADAGGRIRISHSKVCDLVWGAGWTKRFA